jgi:hypothetical protein
MFGKKVWISHNGTINKNIFSALYNTHYTEHKNMEAHAEQMRCLWLPES